MSHSPLYRLPAVRSRSSIRAAGSLAALALLSACASTPQISAQQESTQYLSHARRSYTPPGPSSDPWGPYVGEASTKFDVPERWIREVMHQESGGRLYGRGGDLITSGAGAMGLMQVMPGTYDELKARYSELGSDPFDPHNNILAGTAYIREMYDIYGSPGFLAAYNAGPGRLDDYLTRSRSLPEETRRYVASIGPKIAGSFPSTRSPGEQYAMNSIPMQIPDGPRYAGGRAAPIEEQPRYSPAVASALNPVPYTPSIAPARPTVQVAQLPEPPAERQGNYIKLSPQPMQVAEIPEPPRFEPQGSYITLSPQPFQVVQVPEPPRVESQANYPPQPATRPVQVAQLPEPPRMLPEPPRPQAVEHARFAEHARSVEPARQYAALAPVVPPRPSAFSLVSQANAAPIGIHRGGFAPGNWAVQVGAFENANLASAATVAARDTARDVLGGARPAVSTVRQPRGMLYRARLVGLSHDAAAHACERLVRTRTNCMLVSPEAQS